MEHKVEENDIDRLLRENPTASFLGVSTRALQSWRCRGCGPPFVRISSRAVRYRLRDLIEWSKSRLKNSTSEK